MLYYFVSPRGLVTILLFYQIIPEQRVDFIDDGVLMVVVLLSNLLMMVGLLINKEGSIPNYPVKHAP